MISLKYKGEEVGQGNLEGLDSLSSMIKGLSSKDEEGRLESLLSIRDMIDTMIAKYQGVEMGQGAAETKAENVDEGMVFKIKLSK